MEHLGLLSVALSAQLLPSAGDDLLLTVRNPWLGANAASRDVIGIAQAFHSCVGRIVGGGSRCPQDTLVEHAEVAAESHAAHRGCLALFEPMFARFHQGDARGVLCAPLPWAILRTKCPKFSGKLGQVYVGEEG